MTFQNGIKFSVDSAPWQDYRASDTGMVVYYVSDPISELPIREIPEELPSEVLPEPNYESGSYGLYGCGKSKIRNSFFKSKIRYLLFITKYAGTSADFKDKIFITGYYKINKAADVKKIHIRYLADYSCLDEDKCMALRAEEYRFVGIEDAFEVTDAVLKSWDYKARITRQTRIVLDEEQTLKVIDFLRGKPDRTEDYIAETERLWPHEIDTDEVEE
jgi:hypothetical protein